MVNKKKLKKAIDTLMYSWGGDTPQEATWAFNELMEAFNMQATIDDEEDVERGVDGFEKELENHVF